jgi:hypothetical protein
MFVASRVSTNLIECVTITPVTNEGSRAIAWEYVGLGVLDRVVTGTLSVNTCSRKGHINNPPFLWGSRG